MKAIFKGIMRVLRPLLPSKEITVIHPEDRLLRRVQYLDPTFIKDDGTPSSASFTLKKTADGALEDGLSVDLEKLTTYPKAIQDLTRFRLFYLKAQYCTSLGLENVHDPQDENEAHSLVKGNITKSIARKLAQEAKRIKYPD
jgi:hypothetical protein